jgi:hypothetical protein
MKPGPSIIAQRLLSLYRQHHVILGGWATLNPVFLKDADSDVIAELAKLPNGLKLAEHIDNLQSGKTSRDGIARELMPYGGAFAEITAVEKFSEMELFALEYALEDFQPDAVHLQKVLDLTAVKKFGEQWPIAVRAALAGRDDLLEKWKLVQQTERAYNLWGQANQILSAPLSERVRASVQADLPEYETYLPMFGDSGNALLSKLRTFVSVNG